MPDQNIPCPTTAPSTGLTQTKPHVRQIGAFAVVVVVSVILMIGEIFLLPARFNSAAWFAYALFCGAVLILEGYVWWQFFVKKASNRFGCSSATTFWWGLGGSVVAAFVLELCTLIGAPEATPFQLGDWQPVRLVIFFLVSFVFFCVICFASFATPHPVRALMRVVRNTAAVKRGGLFVSVVVLASLLFTTVVVVCTGRNMFTVFFFTLALAITIGALVVMGRAHDLYPERLFLVIALSFGMYMAAVFPTETGISWDDGIHYDRSVSLSYGVAPEYTASDEALAVRQNDPTSPFARPNISAIVDGKWTYTIADINVFNRYYYQLNEAYATGPVKVLPSGAVCASVSNFHTSTDAASQPITTITSISYLPSAFGLWLGRLLHLPFIVTYDLGRVMNLLVYCFICFWAIKLIPVKKILMCVVALLPTALFLASSYSYDPWTNAFLLLGVALVVRALRAKDGSLRATSWLAMVAVFFVGLCPKPVYFPLMGLMLLVPRKKFSHARAVYAYRIIVVLTALIALASFALPFLISGTGGNDMRGGEGVNSAGQIQFIFTHPLGFIYALVSFLFGHYLLPQASSEWTTDLAFLGNPALLFPLLGDLVPLFLVGVALSDSCEQSFFLGTVKKKLWSVVVVGLSLVLATTSLYISFTAVGTLTVWGMQGRYLIPLVFPFIVFCLSFRFTNKMNYNHYVKWVLGCSSFLIALCIATEFTIKML